MHLLVTEIRCRPTALGRNLTQYLSSCRMILHGTVSPFGDAIETCGSEPSIPSISNVLSARIEACFTPSPLTIVFNSDIGAGDMLHENGEPGTASPLNLTDNECDAASVGRKFTLKRAFPSD